MQKKSSVLFYKVAVFLFKHVSYLDNNNIIMYGKKCKGIVTHNLGKMNFARH